MKLSRRDDIKYFWNIQEGLLQQYRIMAITLLGLLAAGILVLVSFLLSEGAATSWAQDRYFETLILLIMFFTLWLLGIVGTHNFRLIILERSRMVTFFQNMLIADESGKLDDIIAKSGAPKKLPLMYVCRRIGSHRLRPAMLPLEAGIDFNADLFVNELYLENEVVNNWRLRHHKTRPFLSKFIFIVFYLFFVLSGLILLIQFIQYFGTLVRLA